MKLNRNKILFLFLFLSGLSVILYLLIHKVQKPGILPTNIYHYSIQQGQEFSEISLGDLIPGKQASDLRWSFEGNKIVNLILLPSARVRVNIPDKNWTGTDTISFVAVNRDNQQFITLGVFTVLPGKNPPELLNIPDQTITAGGSFKPIELDDFILFSVSATESIQWSWRGNENLILKIDSQNRLTVKPINKNYTGKETVTLVATNQYGLSVNQDVYFTILPEKKSIGFSLPEEIQLNSYEDDLVLKLDQTFMNQSFENENLLWQVTGLKYLSAQLIDNRYLHLRKSNPNWYGIDTASISISNKQGFSGLSKLVISLTPKSVVNLKPFIIISGKENYPINLKEYIYTNNDIPITFSVEDNDNFFSEIGQDNLLKISNKNLRWEGSDTIYIAAHLTDDFIIRASLPVIFVSRFNPPSVIQLSEQTIEQGESFSTINLNNHLIYEGKEKEEIAWSHSGGGNLQVDISSEGLAFVSSINPDWYGSDTITFSANINDRYQVNTKGIFTVYEPFFYDKQPFKPIKNIFFTGVNDGISLIKAPLSWDSDDLAALQSIIIGTLILSRYDQPLQKQVIKDRRYFNSFVMEFGEWYGRSSTPQLAALAVAGFGLATGNDKATRIGLEIFEAYFFANNINSIMKRTFGRARPGEEKGSYYFTPFGDRPNPQNALPSGHATLSFALSSVLAAHTDQVWLKALIFTPAVITGVSRIYHNSHWLSDVFLGSAIGYFVGNFVVSRHSDKVDKNFIINLLPGGVGFYYKL
jgi:hypothetical protein